MSNAVNLLGRWGDHWEETQLVYWIQNRVCALWATEPIFCLRSFTQPACSIRSEAAENLKYTGGEVMQSMWVYTLGLIQICVVCAINQDEWKTDNRSSTTSWLFKTFLQTLISQQLITLLVFRHQSLKSVFIHKNLWLPSLNRQSDETWYLSYLKI